MPVPSPAGDVLAWPASASRMALMDTAELENKIVFELAAPFNYAKKAAPPIGASDFDIILWSLDGLYLAVWTRSAAACPLEQQKHTDFHPDSSWL